MFRNLSIIAAVFILMLSGLVNSCQCVIFQTWCCVVVDEFSCREDTKKSQQLLNLRYVLVYFFQQRIIFSDLSQVTVSGNAKKTKQYKTKHQNSFWGSFPQNLWWTMQLLVGLVWTHMTCLQTFFSVNVKSVVSLHAGPRPRNWYAHSCHRTYLENGGEMIATWTQTSL